MTRCLLITLTQLRRFLWCTVSETRLLCCPQGAKYTWAVEYGRNRESCIPARGTQSATSALMSQRAYTQNPFRYKTPTNGTKLSLGSHLTSTSNVCCRLAAAPQLHSHTNSSTSDQRPRTRHASAPGILLTHMNTPKPAIHG